MREDPQPVMRWYVSGRVQGVGFRWFVVQRATELGINGWVRNLPDGRVEVLGKGLREAMEAMELSLRSGPRMSRVDNVEKTDLSGRRYGQYLKKRYSQNNK